MQAQYNPGVSANGWLSCPDNLAFDTRGRLWISTDGANNFNYGDGLWASDVVGPGRALTRHFFRCPIGGETTGPTFTPDGTTLFCSVQHPGDEGDSSFVKPITRWPDFKDGIPPRPSVVAIRAKDGRPIG
jgi:secreted PhoX family phosphatase